MEAVLLQNTPMASATYHSSHYVVKHQKGVSDGLFEEAYEAAEMAILARLNEVIEQETLQTRKPFESLDDFITQVIGPLLRQNSDQSAIPEQQLTIENDPYGHLAHYYALERM